MRLRVVLPEPDACPKTRQDLHLGGVMSCNSGWSLEASARTKQPSISGMSGRPSIDKLKDAVLEQQYFPNDVSGEPTPECPKLFRTEGRALTMASSL